MMLSMARILDAEVSFRSRRLVAPLQLSSGSIEELTEATASVVVEAPQAGGPAGRGSLSQRSLGLAGCFAHWPSERDEALRRLCEKIADELPIQFRNENLHPLELGLRLDDLACHRLSIARARRSSLAACAAVHLTRPSTMRPGSALWRVGIFALPGKGRAAECGCLFPR